MRGIPRNVMGVTLYDQLVRFVDHYPSDVAADLERCADALYAAGYWQNTGYDDLYAAVFTRDPFDKSSHQAYAEKVRVRTNFYVLVSKVTRGEYKRFIETDFRKKIDRHGARLISALTLCEQLFIHDSTPAYLVESIAQKICRYDRLAEFLAEIPRTVREDPENRPLFRQLLEYFDDDEVIEICQHEEALDEMIEILKRLKEAGIPQTSATPFYHPTNLLVHRKLTLYALTTLQEAGCHYRTHPAVYKKVMSELCNEAFAFNDFAQGFENLLEFLQTIHFRPMTRSFLTRMDAAIDSAWSKAPYAVTHGPLNKSKGTTQVEALIKRIIRGKIEDFRIYYSPESGYGIYFVEGEVLRLSLLLEYSNLTHLLLEQSTIESMARFIADVAPELSHGPLSDNIVASKFYPEEQRAIERYSGNAYEDINRIFRGEAVEDAENSSREKIIALLCTGFIIINAVNRLPNVADSIPERRLILRIAHSLGSSDRIPGIVRDREAYNVLLKRASDEGLISEVELTQLRNIQTRDLKILFPDTTYLDRAENLGGKFIRQRTANPVRYPQLTSFSAHKNGAASFIKDFDVRTKLEGFSTPFEIADKDEREVLFAPGTQIKTFGGPGGLLISRIYCSPDFEPESRFFSETALLHAYEKHLREDYNDNNFSFTVNEKDLPRPTYGLAHTYRVMRMIEPVIHYYAAHGIEPGFRSFCQKLGEGEREWLRTAAAFSVTGLEAEPGFGANPKRYRGYRNASKMYFKNYINDQHTTAPQLSGVSRARMRDRLAHVLRYIGIQGYERTIDDQPPINQHSDAAERRQRNFYHRILSLAQTLDNPRRMTPEKFFEALKHYDDWVRPSAQQKTTLNQLIFYAIELIKAHGDKLVTDINGRGDLFLNNHERTPIFNHVSESLRELRLFTDGVKRPRIDACYADEPESLKRHAGTALKMPARKKTKFG